MNYSDSILGFYDKNRFPIIVYGTGRFARNYCHYIPDIAYMCDTYPRENYFEGIKVISPDELLKMKQPLIIVICVKKVKVANEIKSLLRKLDIDAYVFEFGRNVDFNCYRPKIDEKKNQELKYVRLVCYESEGWIIYKFAAKLKEELEKKNIKATIGNTPDPQADINHHIESVFYEPITENNDTVMISHVLNRDTLESVFHQMDTVKMGICMSKETMNKLVQWGVPREKLCYVNPAHDGVIPMRKYVIGITHRNYSDNRKRQGALIDICKELNPKLFSIKIMGAGWEDQVSFLQELGFEVEYFPQFDYSKYSQLLQETDFYLFWGMDEGSMGYLDAIAAGAETLVTPQGFHLDVKNGITYPCTTIKDFVDVLLEKQHQKEQRLDSIKEWTWERYAEKHIKIWKYILGSISDEEFYENQHMYEDGEFSIFRYRNIWRE